MMALPALAKIIVSLITAIAMVYGIMRLIQPGMMAISDIRLLGALRFIDRKKVDQLINEQSGAGFFDFDVSVLKNALQDLPWVQQVAIRKIWPKRLDITLQERKAVAYWGTHALLDAQGAIFYPELLGNLKLTKLKLPLFKGPEQYRKAMLDKAQQLKPKLAALKLKLSSVSLSPRKAWVFGLSNGLIINLGKGDFENKMKRFFDLYQNFLFPRVKQIQAIDLRYPNGAAVSWNNLE